MIRFRLAALFVCVLVSTASATDRKSEAVNEAYKKIMLLSWPAIPESCGPELRQLLVDVSKLPKRAAVDEYALLAKLHEKKCIDQHFHVHIPSDIRIVQGMKAQCQKPPVVLEKVSGVWQLRFNDFLWSGPGYGAHGCKNRTREFVEFRERLASGKTEFRPGDPYILNLMDVPGGSDSAMNFALGGFFAYMGGMSSYSVMRRTGPNLEIGQHVTTPRWAGVMGCPLFIFVNHETASAAEVMGDQVRSWCNPLGKAYVIGQTTLGKFAKTAFLPVGNAEVQFSVEIYKTSGAPHTLNYIGIIPDEIVPPGMEMERALLHMKRMDLSSPR